MMGVAEDTKKQEQQENQKEEQIFEKDDFYKKQDKVVRDGFYELYLIGKKHLLRGEYESEKEFVEAMNRSGYTQFLEEDPDICEWCPDTGSNLVFNYAIPEIIIEQEEKKKNEAITMSVEEAKVKFACEIEELEAWFDKCASSGMMIKTGVLNNRLVATVYNKKGNIIRSFPVTKNETGRISAIVYLGKEEYYIPLCEHIVSKRLFVPGKFTPQPNEISVILQKYFLPNLNLYTKFDFTGIKVYMMTMDQKNELSSILSGITEEGKFRFIQYEDTKNFTVISDDGVFNQEDPSYIKVTVEDGNVTVKDLGINKEVQEFAAAS